ncbi:tRNA uridine-5-carboxymethylaminomethyl(34) synthesis enzyme MnmG [Sphingomonas montanisoli]|uniref:tRNA uridine 5-carboxymethylaminomethyl modification enzyme MnmG n=1 Tax=Sphingomonas montanisoli TaxID=2606412 RepID=A0A5D9C5H3_9SPHN|nr:tRNA uridine-5-carboxymethylaminomethyl(34) synthesis enzyme MnmG [Sphingomonas montanisoli]
MDFDVIIVGGGHAGSEAAAAAARMGAHVALLSMDRNQIGTMSCNPAIGGLGKGHLVREVDACDGLMARAADAAAIHHRMLNKSKGAAVQGPRVQADRLRYRDAVQATLAAEPNLQIVEGMASRLIVRAGAVEGVELEDGRRLTGRAVVLATGTFLGARLHFGLDSIEGGRIEERAATAMAAQLRELDLPMARLKTGTPPRLDGRTIDWAQLERQASDEDGWTFSAMTAGRRLPQLACFITRTNTTTHDIIRDGLDRSPLFSGAIEGSGPRYCPSIEDKVLRFGDRDGHQIFLEPEGLDDHLIYPNGISTSLPLDTQRAMLRSMAGLRSVEIVRPGYAVEYDHIDPRALDPDLRLRAMGGIYCAGQLNGTTGYEEAAAQGLVAGANAAAFALGKSPVLWDRATSYIGVMIDDLTLQGVTEPYRMLTARAEYRLRLRADNSGTRLTGWALSNGLISNDRRMFHVEHEAQREALRTIWQESDMSSKDLRTAGADLKDDSGVRRSGWDWLRFPEVEPSHIATLVGNIPLVANDVIAELGQDARYAPYVERQEQELARLRADSELRLDRIMDYRSVGGLSNEMIERLNKAMPADLGRASQVRGVTPAALTAIMLHARRAA